MLVTFTIIPYLHVTIINKCHYWKNIVLHIFCTRFSTCPEFVLCLQVAWWSVLSRSKTARYPTRIPTLLQNTGWLHILLAFEEIWHRSHWNWFIDKIEIDYQGGCSHQNACQPKDLGRDRRPCGLTIYFRTIFKILAILLLNDFRKKTWQLMYQWNIFQNVWNIFQNIWNIYENNANIFSPGLHLPLLCWHKYHPRGNGGNLTMKAIVNRHS